MTISSELDNHEPDAVVVAHDRVDAQYEIVLCIYGRHMLISKHVFPGYSNRALYYKLLSDQDIKGFKASVAGATLYTSRLPGGVPVSVSLVRTDGSLKAKYEMRDSAALSLHEYSESIIPTAQPLLADQDYIPPHGSLDF